MSFWRKQVVDFALDQETQRHVEEQREWIAQEPANPVPYKNLAQLCRILGRQDDALGLLLEAVRLKPEYGEAHVELAEIYAVRGDTRSAWKHARQAERNGHPRVVELLGHYNVPET